MLRVWLFVIAVFLAVQVCPAQTIESQPPLWHARPDPAAFEKSEEAHLDSAQRYIDRLTGVQGPRTIENTLAPYDDAVRELNSAGYFAALMEQVHPEAAFRDRATAMVRKVSAAQTALSLNRAVYDALEKLNAAKADAPTRHYLERQLLEFRLSGVNKDDATRARLRKLNDEVTQTATKFDRNISDSKETIEATVAELDGLPQDYIARHKPGPDGKVVLTTQYPDYFPVMKFAQSDALRRRALVAFLTRAYPTNRDVLMNMLRARYEIATTLGYKSWADYNAADKMIEKGSNIAAFIAQLDTAARPAGERELAMLLAEKRKQHPDAKTIEDFESGYYQELVRRAQYNFDSASVRPYLPYARVKQGILDTAAKLFGLTFRQETGATEWAPQVETWIAYENGKPVGRFYLDMHPREGKFSHAEMAPVLDGIKGKQLPEAALVCNFPVPTATDPGLMEYGDVVTFFHEFGHLMHWILGGRQEWAGISGISMEADFVEAPSQMLEEWMRSPVVLASFAKNYKTGEPIPADLVRRMNRASAFGRGNGTMQQNAYTAYSYDIYKDVPEQVKPDALLLQDITKYTLFTPTPGTHMWASFGHLGGYSSAYYTYMWDKEIALDFFSQFNAENPFLGDAAARYRRLVLEPGGSMPANELVRNFLGRPQNMDAFKRWINEEFTSSERP